MFIIYYIYYEFKCADAETVVAIHQRTLSVHLTFEVVA